MYISSVTLMSTTGQVGALPPMCLGGSNVGGSTISTGVNNPYGVNSVNPYTGMPAQTQGSFAIAAGAQIQCVFNVSAGELVTASVGLSGRGVSAQPTPCTSLTGNHASAALWCTTPCCFCCWRPAGTGTATQGQVYAQATTTSSYVSSSGNTAMSQPITLNLIAPTQQWDIGGCVTFRCVAERVRLSVCG